jgi:hypothetical protein
MDGFTTSVYFPYTVIKSLVYGRHVDAYQVHTGRPPDAQVLSPHPPHFRCIGNPAVHGTIRIA